MSELKTLKDIGRNLCIDRVDLRKEAIKWVKKCGCYPKSQTKCNACWKFLGFFNITSEELDG